MSDALSGILETSEPERLATGFAFIYFTDPGLPVPLADRELPYAGVYRVTPDERRLYVANTRWTQYIHVLELDAGGAMVRRRIFADMSSDETEGVPDGRTLFFTARTSIYALRAKVPGQPHPWYRIRKR